MTFCSSPPVLAKSVFPSPLKTQKDFHRQLLQRDFPLSKQTRNFIPTIAISSSMELLFVLILPAPGRSWSHSISPFLLLLPLCLNDLVPVFNPVEGVSPQGTGRECNTLANGGCRGITTPTELESSRNPRTGHRCCCFSGELWNRTLKGREEIPDPAHWGM